MEIFIPLDIVHNMYVVETCVQGENLDSSVSAEFDFNTEVYLESNLKVQKKQINYLEQAKKAAYESLNDLDKSNFFNAEVTLTHQNSETEFNLGNDSNSSGLAYSIALALEWRKQLGKNEDIAFNIIATGAVDDVGKVRTIEHLTTKIKASLELMTEPFVFFYPKDDETPEILEQILQAKENLKNNKGVDSEYIGIKYLYEALGNKHLLGDAYDGKPTERSLMFKGFSSFELEDATRFFGRESLKGKLKERYDNSKNLIVVYGDSGVGKSSLCKAGLFFDVKKDNSSINLHIKTSTPSDSVDENKRIPFLLFNLLEFVGGQVVDNEIVKETAFSSELTDLVLKCIEASLDTGQHYLWYIDQFEEIFTQTDIDIAQAREFVRLLDSVVGKYSAKLKIVVSVRAEYKKYFSERLLFEVTDVTPDDIEEILTKQANSLHLVYQNDSEGDLKREIKKEIKSLEYPLPALQFLLKQLQDKKTSKNVLLYKEYKDLDGLRGVIAKKTESYLSNDFGGSDLFFELFVGCDNDHNLYARRVNISQAIKTAVGMKKIIDKLIEKQLLIYTTPSKSEVKLAHDSLIKVNNKSYQWDLFETWYSGHKDYLAWFNRIENKYNEWLKGKMLAANDK
jgi:hypothetical protein